LYLAGGVALHLLDGLKDPRFLQGFTKKGRFKELMERIPVHLMTTRAALVGAATFGLESLNKIRNGTGTKLSLASSQSVR
jgi:glucokinase